MRLGIRAPRHVSGNEGASLALCGKTHPPTRPRRHIRGLVRKDAPQPGPKANIRGLVRKDAPQPGPKANIRALVRKDAPPPAPKANIPALVRKDARPNPAQKPTSAALCGKTQASAQPATARIPQQPRSPRQPRRAPAPRRSAGATLVPRELPRRGTAAAPPHSDQDQLDGPPRS